MLALCCAMLALFCIILTLFCMHSNVKKLLLKLSQLINVKHILVTRGANGAICYNTKSGKFYEAPAFATKIIDKVGAGDTLLALFSIFFFGGEILKGFAFAMILGVVLGTYSSIFIANPVLVYLRVSYKTIVKDED